LSDVLSRLSAALGDRYLLERELGHGGMATVYLARDAKHRRMVALKVLRPELAASLGPARFLHEIEIAAQLQHPHILPLLDSGEVDGFLYYVMPYVEGESLRERLAHKGEFPVPEAVRILAEVADALAYAHRRDVVHRDMKPDNIMLSGRHPLVMDFGIAKAVNPTPGSQHPTTAGVALGTPAYMAPEQAAADPHLDHRVDIYALGVIGYELLTGTPPFGGGSSQQILAAHMTQRPEPISSRRPSIPPRLATLIMQCLEKRPADRPQTADEILHTLETMVTPGEGVTPTGSRPVPALTSPTSRWALVMVGAIVIATVAALLWRSQSPTGNPVVPNHTQLTFVGNIDQQDVSPDGQFLAYIDGGETKQLVVKDLTGSSIIPVATLGHSGGTLRWAPDGSTILYAGEDSSGQWVRVLFPRLGGAPRQVPSRAPFGVFSPDGSRIAGWGLVAKGSIYIRRFTTNAIDSVTVPKSAGWRYGGDWSPDGRVIAFQTLAETGSRWMLWAANVETGKSHQILTDTVSLSPPRWASGGKALYYIRNNNELCKIRVSDDGRSVGVPEVLQTGLGASGFSITADGRKLVYIREQSQSNLWLATKSLRAPRFITTQLTSGTAFRSGPRTSPDGRMIAFVQVEQGVGDVYVIPANGGAPRQVTSSGVAMSSGPDAGVAWSPNGRHLAYIATVQGAAKVRTVPVEGGQERTYERTEVGEGTGLAWAPADRILYHRPGNRNFHWVDTTSGAETPLVTNDSVGWMFRPLISPDRQWVAVFWNREPHRGVYLISPKDGSQTPIGPANSEALGWSRDGASIYVEEEPSRRIHRIPMRGGSGVFVGTNPFKGRVHGLGGCELNDRPATIALLCSVDESRSDIWMIENFDPEDRP
jgi:serine/threonine protein kinase